MRSFYIMNESFTTSHAYCFYTNITSRDVDCLFFSTAVAEVNGITQLVGLFHKSLHHLTFQETKGVVHYLYGRIKKLINCTIKEHFLIHKLRFIFILNNRMMITM